MTQLHSNQPIFWDDLHRAQRWTVGSRPWKGSRKLLANFGWTVERGRPGTWSFAEGTEYSMESTWLFSWLYSAELNVMWCYLCYSNLFRLHFSVNNMRMLIHATKSDQEQMWGLTIRESDPTVCYCLGLCFGRGYILSNC